LRNHVNFVDLIMDLSLVIDLNSNFLDLIKSDSHIEMLK